MVFETITEKSETMWFFDQAFLMSKRINKLALSFLPHPLEEVNWFLTYFIIRGSCKEQEFIESEINDIIEILKPQNDLEVVEETPQFSPNVNKETATLKVTSYYL